MCRFYLLWAQSDEVTAWSCCYNEFYIVGVLEIRKRAGHSCSTSAGRNYNKYVYNKDKESVFTTWVEYYGLVRLRINLLSLRAWPQVVNSSFSSPCRKTQTWYFCKLNVSLSNAWKLSDVLVQSCTNPKTCCAKRLSGFLPKRHFKVNHCLVYWKAIC